MDVMKRRTLLLALALGAILAFRPDEGRTNPLVSMIGLIAVDTTSCPPANYVLLDWCTRAPIVYLEAKPKRMDPWVGRTVTLRGSLDVSGPCPIVKVQRLFQFTPPCPPG